MGHEMAVQLKKLARPEATNAIVDEIQKLIAA